MRYIACQTVVDGWCWVSVDRSTVARNAGEVPTIKDLIRAALGAGKTVRQLEADSDYRVRFQTFQELSNHPPKQFPKHSETIAGMADALNVSHLTIVLAYAAGLGIPVHAGSTFALRLPPDVDHLEPAMQDAILQLTRAAVSQSVGAGRRVAVAVTENEPQYFPTFQRERLGDAEAGEVAGEDRKQNG